MLSFNKLISYVPVLKELSEHVTELLLKGTFLNINKIIGMNNNLKNYLYLFGSVGLTFAFYNKIT
jgi:hypothetical protein